MSNFHPLEVVGLSSETQLQVRENLNQRILDIVQVIPLKLALLIYMCPVLCQDILVLL